MLGEAFELLRALERAGVELPSFQRGIATPGKSSPCVRVRLREDGTVSVVEAVTPDDWPAWTHLDGNQNSFPVIRLAEPLLETGSERASAVWRALGFNESGERKAGARKPSQAELRTALSDAVATLPRRRPSKKARDDWRRLRRKAARLRTMLVGCGELACVHELTRRFRMGAWRSAWCRTEDDVLDDVSASIVASVKGALSAGVSGLEEAAQLLLVGKGPPSQRNPMGPKFTVQVALDRAEADGNRVYSMDSRRRLEAFLGASTRSGPTEGSACE